MISKIISPIKRGQNARYLAWFHVKLWILVYQEVSWKRIHIRYEFMEYNEFIYPFIGCTKKVSFQRILIYEFINEFLHTCEFIHELIWKHFFWIHMWSHVRINIQNVDSYMNSYTNKHNMTIRMFQVWRSGCSRSERRRRLLLWCRGGGESLSQWGWLLRAKEGSGAIGVRRAAASDWAVAIEAGFCKWRWVAASDYRDGPLRVMAGPGWLRRVTAGRCEWLGLLRVWRVMDGGPLRVTRAGASEPG